MEPTDHYFSDDPQAPSQPIEVELEVRGLHLRLRSDRGVFSKSHVDPGTLLLARTAQLPERGAILDLGCGNGALGVVAAMLCPQASVVLVDVNSRAADLARYNCERYGLANAVVLVGDAPSVLGQRAFHTILCNPPYHAGKAAVMSLLADAATRLEPDGALWIVGRRKQGIKTLARDLSPHLAEIQTAAIKGGYRVIVGKAPSAGR